MRFPMAAARTDKTRQALVVATIVVAALAVAGTRLVASVNRLQRANVPVADIQTLSPFLAPLPADTSRPDSSRIVVGHDSFAPAGVTTRPAAAIVGQVARSTRTGEPWILSSIL